MPIKYRPGLQLGLRALMCRGPSQSSLPAQTWAGHGWAQNRLGLGGLRASGPAQHITRFIAEWGWSCVIYGKNILASQKEKSFRSSRLPARPWLSAGISLLQKTKRLEDALRLVEELGERSGAAVSS
jgi:hypothetical protein